MNITNFTCSKCENNKMLFVDIYLPYKYPKSLI